MTHLRRLAAVMLASLGLALATPASADAGPGRCTGSFVNPITDICWPCLFPISVGGLKIWPSSRPDPTNPDPAAVPVRFAPGIAMGFWEPVRLADVSMKPWCFVNLGGMKLDPGFDIGFDKRPFCDRRGEPELLELARPLVRLSADLWMEIAGFPVPANRARSTFSTSPSSIRCGRTANSPRSSIPRRVLFANPLALAACAADCVVRDRPTCRVDDCSGARAARARCTR